MKYVFIDTDNGMTTPDNDTPDTSTSKYHTSWDGVTWPASTARWLQANSAAANATITALTDDVTFVVRGATDDSLVTLSNSLQAASIVFVGDATGPVWDSSKYTIFAGGTSSHGFRVQRQANVTAKNVQVVCSSSATNTRCVLIDPVSGTSTYTIDGFKLKQGGTGAGGVALRSSVSIGITVNVLNTIAVNDNATTTPSGFGFTGGNTVNVYNCVVNGFVNGINTADTVKNCAVYDNTDDFVTCTTVAYCASDDGDGTNAVTGLTWANQFVDYANGNFALKSGSSLIGAGIGPSSDANVPSTDIAGVTRSGTTTDIGAANYVPVGLSITSVTPSSFDDGRTGIVIAGSGFGASQGSSTLTIGGQAQTVTAWSDTSITFTSVRGSVSPGNATLVLSIGTLPDFSETFEAYADVAAAVSGPWDSQDTALGGTHAITTFQGSKRYACTWVNNESRTMLWYRFPGATNGDVATGKSYVKLEWDEYRDVNWDFQADKSCRFAGRQANGNVTLDVLLGLEGTGTPGSSTRAVVFGQGLGTNSNFVIDTDWAMNREQWYTIAVEIKLNVVGGSDGWIKLYRDGVLMGSATNLNIRGGSNDYTFHQVAVGGWESGGAPVTSETRYIDNVKVWYG